MQEKFLNNLKIIFFVILTFCFFMFSNGSIIIPLKINFQNYSIKDTIFTLNKVKAGIPSDSIIVIKKTNKTKLLSKEGIVYKQYAKNTESLKKTIVDSSANFNSTANKKNNTLEKTKKNVFQKSLINNVFNNKNLTELPSTNLFSQLTDKKNLSKLEFLNTVKQLNNLKKEIYKKNAEKKKTNPVRWLVLLIAAILIVIILAFFIKEIFTLFLIGVMLVALVLLIGFL